MAKNQKLNIVDENGKIIGEGTRENIHKHGLLHRGICVLFYTPKGEIIFQHREKNKDTYPDLLDATVGGHVEIGADYENTALQEIEEETGIKTEKDKLHFVQMIRIKDYDQITNKINNVIRAIYAYYYDEKIKDLKIEKDEAMGFEAWSFEKIFNISDINKKRFIPVLLKKEYLKIFHKIQKLCKK